MPEVVKQTWNDWRRAIHEKAESERKGEVVVADADRDGRHESKDAVVSAAATTVDMAGWGVAEAEEKHEKEASKSLRPLPQLAPSSHIPGLATQLALAYAIHKTFIFVRVPLTAAVLPSVVRTLRAWGFDIGRRSTLEARAARRVRSGVVRRRWHARVARGVESWRWRGGRRG